MCAIALVNNPVLKSTARANGDPAAVTNKTRYAPITTNSVANTTTMSMSLTFANRNAITGVSRRKDITGGWRAGDETRARILKGRCDASSTSGKNVLVG